MIRRAALKDIDAIVDLAVESVSRNPLPVQIDRPAMAETARQLIGSPAHFAWVGERDGRVTAAVGACAQKAFWFRGVQASVLMFYAREPGDGVALLCEFARWVKSRPIIKTAVIELEPHMDPRIERLCVRLGFGRKSTNVTYVRNT